MICPNCQHNNENNGRFCIRCGAPLLPVPAPKKESPFKKGFIATLKALCYVFLFFVMQTVVTGTYTAIVSFGKLLSAGGNMDYDVLLNEVLDLVYENIHVVMILTAGLTLLILFLSFHIRRKNPLKEMHLRPVGAAPALFSLLLGAAVQVVVVVIISFIPLPQEMIEEMNQNSELLLQGSAALQFIDIAIVTPILEEIIFRGLAFSRLRRGMRTGLAVALSAAIFGAAHGTIVAFVYAGLLGALCALLMLRHNDSILPTILCHAGFNGASFLMQYVPDNSLIILSLFFVSLAAAVVLLYLLFKKKEPVSPSFGD